MCDTGFVCSTRVLRLSNGRTSNFMREILRAFFRCGFRTEIEQTRLLVLHACKIDAFSLETNSVAMLKPFEKFVWPVESSSLSINVYTLTTAMAVKEEQLVRSVIGISRKLRRGCKEN